MSYNSAMDSATGLKRGSIVTSRTRSPSIHISRSSRSESKYCRPVLVIVLLSLRSRPLPNPAQVWSLQLLWQRGSARGRPRRSFFCRFAPNRLKYPVRSAAFSAFSGRSAAIPAERLPYIVSVRTPQSLLVRNAKSHDPVAHHSEWIIKFAFHARIRRQGSAHCHPLHHFNRVLTAKPCEIGHGVSVQLLRGAFDQVHKFAVPLRRDAAALGTRQRVRKPAGSENNNASVARKTTDRPSHGFAHLPAALGRGKRRQDHVDGQRHHGNFPAVIEQRHGREKAVIE